MAPVVVRRMPAAEKVESGRRIRGEPGVVLQPACEFSLQGGIRVEHGFGDLLGHIGLDLFLLLETGVEESPRGQGIRRLGLEHGHDEP